MLKFASLISLCVAACPTVALAFDAIEPIEGRHALGSCSAYMKLNTAAKVAMIVVTSGIDENNHARASHTELGIPEGREHLARIPELTEQFLRSQCGLSYVNSFEYSYGAASFVDENFVGFTFVARDRATSTTNQYVFGFAGKTDTKLATIARGVNRIADTEQIKRLRIDGRYGWVIHKQYMSTEELLERFATRPYGVTTYEDGTYFEGFLTDEGKPAGTGIHIMPDGTGANIRNVDGVIQGWGHVIDRHGDEYIGDFLDGERTGKGVLKLASGQMSCAGDFVNGVIIGRGTGIRQGKRVYCGLRENRTMWSEPRD